MGTQRLRHPELYADPAYLDLIARLAANTRRLRRERGWTQEQAAERCNMATLVLQTVEGGRKNFTGTVISRLCKGFGVDVREFFAPAAPLARSKPGRPRKARPEEAADTPTTTAVPPASVPPEIPEARSSEPTSVSASATAPLDAGVDGGADAVGIPGGGGPALETSKPR